MKLEKVALLLVVLSVLYAGWYVYDHFADWFPGQESGNAQTASGPSSPPPGSATPLQPLPPRYPVALPEKPAENAPQQPAEPPFPTSLDQCDSYLRERLPQLIGDQRLLALLDLKHFLQKFVVFIDSLPTDSIPREHLPVAPLEPGFLTAGEGDTLVIAPGNAERYTPYVSLAEAIPDRALLRLYQGLYPVIWEAYRATGKPLGHFNDRLVQVIDHLLQTPEVQGPVAIVKHVNRFKYADPQLESCSAGQKILLRMGWINEGRIKAKLRRFRMGLVGSPGP